MYTVRYTNLISLEKLMFIEHTNITIMKIQSFILVHLRKLSQLDGAHSIQRTNANDEVGRTCRKGDG